MGQGMLRHPKEGFGDAVSPKRKVGHPGIQDGW
jgi:hypothetical protein